MEIKNSQQTNNKYLIQIVLAFFPLIAEHFKIDQQLLLVTSAVQLLQ